MERTEGRNDPVYSVVAMRIKGNTARKEKWKDVVGYKGLYQVSNQGKIRSLGRVRPDTSFFPGRVLSQYETSSGHLQVSLSKYGKVKKRLSHVLVLEAFVGPCSDDHETCHVDDCPSNNKLSNLRWGTRLNNMRDRIVNDKARKVSVIRDDGVEFDQILKAAGGDKALAGNITAVCRGRRAQAGGFGWHYA